MESPLPLQVYLFVHWCGSYRLPRVSVWLHRSRDKKHLLLVFRILIMCLLTHCLVLLFGKTPFVMHKPPKPTIYSIEGSNVPLVIVISTATFLFPLTFEKYAFLVILLILAEAGAAAFIFFDHSWKDVIPVDKTHNFDVMYDFLKENWEIARWVALGVVVFEALLFLLALVVRAMNKPAEYDSDEIIIGYGRNTGRSTSIRQPLVHAQNVPATGVPVPQLDQRTSRHAAWSQRMREKYGLDTSQFTYNPSDTNRFQQNGAPPSEERSRCIIM
ncbi:hypothetical protein PR202_gb07515 [Eleusine coracana subsp. coracana]|uniref:Uncharacterized protein n=1 Tax=Eleusine coracana subsp. coracana TaxID=191504 RepID=A0AAV5EC87_ELECO|nr:hypothetical protein PR202_gb07515 [Eleusine coracana subsp. coracana]